LFKEASGSKPGAWVVTLDTAKYQAVNTASIPELIANGTVRKAEISVTPKLTVGTVNVALNAVSQTFDLRGGTLVADYYKGANEVVEIDKCNVCHDSLATTFHDGSGRGGGGVQVCKHCHNPTYAGSHLEMQSRSIESYVHAIHSFQDFDVGDTFNTYDPVLAKRYALHTQHVFPNFTIRNCEACHKKGIGAYDVPAQNESLLGLIAASDTVNTWFTLDAKDLPVKADRRQIGTVASYVTGPAARACGSCHTARFINQDQAGELEAFNAHRAAFGTLVNDTTVLYPAINKIMKNFQ
jgi:OmcA/MtrC family decaheme c-type cytochrome